MIKWILNNFRVIVLCIILVCAIFFLISISIFVYHFGSTKFSDNPENWGQFGDFFGGILNPIISIMSLAALGYLTHRISELDHERDEKRLRIEHDREKLALRPLPSLDKNDYSNELKINLSNKGNGPMIIISASFLKNGKYEPDITNHFDAAKLQGCQVRFWSPKYKRIISQGETVEMLSIIPIIGSEKIFKEIVRPSSKSVLKDMVFRLVYKDNVDDVEEVWSEELVIFGDDIVF